MRTVSMLWGNVKVKQLAEITPLTVDSNSANETIGDKHTHALGTINIDDVVSGVPVVYGALYNYPAIADSRKITSSNDWGVCSSTDVSDLITIIGTATDAAKLLEPGLIYWNLANSIGTNIYNFNARGTGYRNGGTGAFELINEITRLWAIGTETDVYIDASYIDAGADFTESNGSAVRLNRDATVAELLLADGTYCALYSGNNGIQYKTVKIGTKVWLAENLNETKYRNGDWIAGFDGGVYTPISDEDWALLETGAMCYYSDNEANGGGEIPIEDVINKNDWHIESKAITPSLHAVSVSFKDYFTGIPSGVGSLKVYRLEPYGASYVFQNVLFTIASDWLTTTGFEIEIDALESLTGVIVDYCFLEKL